MGSSFSLFLAVKFAWIDPTLITISSPTSDRAANFWRARWAWLICFVVTILISLVTRKKPKEELVGLVKGLTAESSLREVSLLKRPELYGFLSILVLILLNLLLLVRSIMKSI
jgi:SSS family solute:Na+ symporter